MTAGITTGTPPALDELGHMLAAEARWRADGYRTAIATVIATWGSSPRRRGAHMVVREDGAFEGSVSGGCVEGDVIVQSVEAIAAGRPRRLDYGVGQAQAWDVGLACGGQISIYVQPIADGLFPPALLEEISLSRVAGQPLSVSTDLEAGLSVAGEERGERWFVQTYDPPLRIAVIGAVHITQALVPMARQLGYQLLVIDPRTMFATPDRFPDVEINTGYPDEVLPDWRPDAASAIVALSHDPKLDDPALRIALASPAFYVGALGSVRTHAARLERLAGQGIDGAALDRIVGPVGLPIGAANPAEIALSIMAGITAAWRLRRR